MEGLPASNGEPALKPFILTHTCDLKASWYLSHRGGGCKTKDFFCTLCSCSRHHLTSYNVDDFRCDRCKRRGKSKCYHHSVHDSVSTEKLLAELKTELGSYAEKHGKTFAEVQKVSKLKTDHMQANKETDVHHIDFFVPYNNRELVKEYSQFISRECRIRGLPLLGSNLEGWRAALRTCVALERKLTFLSTVQEWYDSGRKEVPLVEVVEALIPCILHLENRVSEKILTMILRCGLDKYTGIKMEYVRELERLIQSEVLGTTTSPSNWKLRWTKTTNEPITIDNIQVRNQVGRAMLK